jgi:hypothetical protein
MTAADRQAIERIRRELEAEEREVRGAPEAVRRLGRRAAGHPPRRGRGLALVAAFVLGCLAGAGLGAALTSLYLLAGGGAAPPTLATDPRP